MKCFVEGGGDLQFMTCCMGEGAEFMKYGGGVQILVSGVGNMYMGQQWDVLVTNFPCSGGNSR